jgi:acyl-CoA synthetase (AMP-forming)/AMP-acid ligase II
MFGAIRAQVILVPINWRLTASEIGYQLKDSATRLLIVDPDLLSTANRACELGGVWPTMLPVEGEADSLRNLLEQDAPVSVSPREPNQIILQLYTSGTTGLPKGVLISHYALSLARHSELQIPGLASLGEGAVCLSAMPNFHVGAICWVLMGLVRRGTVIITADPSGGNMLRLFREYNAQHSFIVPTAIRAMIEELKAKNAPAPKVTNIFYGAMAMGEGLLKDAMRVFGCSFGQFFGMTENTGASTFLAPWDHDLARPHLLASVGKPYPGMSLEIRGPDRQLLQCGEHGEVWIKSDTRLVG